MYSTSQKKHRIYIIVITKYSTELQSSVITQHYNVHKNPSNNNYILVRVITSVVTVHVGRKVASTV